MKGSVSAGQETQTVFSVAWWTFTGGDVRWQRHWAQSCKDRNVLWHVDQLWLPDRFGTCHFLFFSPSFIHSSFPAVIVLFSLLLFTVFLLLVYASPLLLDTCHYPVLSIPSAYKACPLSLLSWLVCACAWIKTQSARPAALERVCKDVFVCVRFCQPSCHLENPCVSGGSRVTNTES